MSAPTTAELFNACAVLFGPEVNASLDFLKYLKPSGVKAAFRQKARETHPDRAKIVGKNEALMNELFKEVTQAYEKLNAVIGNDSFFNAAEESNAAPSAGPQSGRSETNRKHGAKSDKTHAHSDHYHHAGARQWFYSAGKQRNSHQANAKSQRQARPRTPDAGDFYYQGRALPRRQLLFGQFLYYSGLISWRSLIASITWQRTNRPAIGQLAIDWNLITPQELRQVLMMRHIGEKFGECAIRMNYMNEFNIKILLWKQQRIQQPIGSYFVQHQLLTPEEIETLAKKARLHNYQTMSHC